MFRTLAKILLVTIAFLIALAITFTGPIDRNPETTTGLFEQFQSSEIPIQAVSGYLKAGWSVKNLMPPYKTPMAGYSPRPEYLDVHDSLFVRCVLLETGGSKVAILSYDLLIVPPRISELIEQNKNDFGIDFVYFSATHTHSGIGGWNGTIGGQALTGRYDEQIVEKIYSASTSAIREAQENLGLASITYSQADGDNLVENRLDKQLPEDGRVNSLIVEKSDGTRGIVTSFGAHATNIDRRGLTISNDYPGALSQRLEVVEFDFAMFLSGSVGSQSANSSFKPNSSSDLDFIYDYGDSLASIIVASKQSEKLDTLSNVSFGTISLPLGKSQLRVSDNLKLRNFAFKRFFAPLDVKIKYLKIGNILMLGMPCDFSGEIVKDHQLYEFAEASNIHLMITSFNGDYLGYITADHHYEKTKRSEIREMNWVGPHHGAYFTKIVKFLMEQ